MSEMYYVKNVEFNAAGMDWLLRDPLGPVGRSLGNAGLRIVIMAKRMTGTVSGRLSKSISMKQARMAGGQKLTVYSNVHYAYWVHEGTHPHVIDPAGHRIMVFNERGRRIYAERVMHPGTRGKRYLTVPMERVIASDF